MSESTELPGLIAIPSTSNTSNATASTSILYSRHYIRDQDLILIKLPSGQLKSTKIIKDASINLGKYGTFKAIDLIGKPFGETYEIKAGEIFLVKATLQEIEETAANNENISAQGAQKLTFFDIETLKSEGMSGREIIAEQIKEHSAFELKTEYSKDKYMKRKEAKYLQMFTPLEPTVHTICQYNFEKQASKIRDLRPDTLAQMMTMANVRPGSKLLVVEDVHGMVVSAATERMGGQGEILIINDADSPPDLHIIESFNFTPEQLAPITSIHWAATLQDYVPPDLPLEIPEGTPKAKSIREQTKIKRRKTLFDKTSDTRASLFAGGFDAVILACEYEPYSVIERLLPYIAGSAPIIIYSPFLQILFEAQQKLKSNPSCLTPILSEPFLRRYQVLPGRTHPEMQGLGHGGFILACTRVIDDAAANSVTAGGRRQKKRKIESVLVQEESAGNGESTDGNEGGSASDAVGNEGLGDL